MAVKKAVFIPFFASDWLGGVAELTCEARGVYIQILALYYAKEGRVRDDDQWLAGQCNLSTRKYRIIKNQLIEYGKISVVDGFIFNDKAKETLKNVRNAQETAEKKARNAAEKRWEKEPETAETSQSDNARSNAPSNASSNAISNLKEEERNIHISKSESNPDTAQERDKASAPEFALLGSELVAKHPINNRADYRPLQTWLDAGIDPNLIRRVVKTVSDRRAVQGGRIDSFKFFEKPIMEAQRLASGGKQERQEANEPPFVARFTDPNYKKWAVRLLAWKAENRWPASWGPMPNEVGCEAPPNVLTAWFEKEAA